MTEITPNALLEPPSDPPGSLVAATDSAVPHRRRIHADSVLKFASSLGAMTVLLMLVALVSVLFIAALPSIREFGFGFITGRTWQPEREGTLFDEQGNVRKDADGENMTGTIPGVYGALPMIYGTAVTSAIAILLAVPLSLGATLFLVRIAPKKLVAPVSFLIEFLAAIPSIAFGLWGLLVLAPFLIRHLEPAIFRSLSWIPALRFMFFNEKGEAIPFTGRDLLCGGIILAIMIIPMITAISRDVLMTVPRAQIEGSIALGATWWQSAKDMLRYSRSGLFGAIMLGLARAAGETMAVAKVIGGSADIRFSPFAQAHTMSSLLAVQFDAAQGLHRSALLEVGLLLLLMSLAFNIVARWLVVGSGARTAAAA